MKNNLLLLSILLLIIGCSDGASDPVTSYATEFSPGTLGAAASTELNCPSNDVAQDLDYLLGVGEFEVAPKDTSSIRSWTEGGYDFLTYRCLTIKNRLYMISVHSEDLPASTISIRSVYKRTKKEWLYAAKFNAVEEQQAEEAMSYLVRHLPTCE